MISRDDRQKICVNKWLQNKGVGTLIQPTGQTAVPIEESLELSSGNIGEGCDANPEISIDSNESIPS